MIVILSQGIGKKSYPVHVSALHIVSYRPEGEYTLVQLSTKETIKVNEEVSDVLQRIRSASG